MAISDSPFNLIEGDSEDAEHLTPEDAIGRIRDECFKRWLRRNTDGSNRDQAK
jgi:hypothetical protein